MLSSGRRSRIALWSAVSSLPVLLSACAPGVLEPKGLIGEANRTILLDSLAIMLVIVIPTILAAFAFGWWFRASNTKAEHLPDWEFSGRIELVVWAIPLMVIILLGGVAWIGSHELDPAKPIENHGAPLDVQVVSLDWKWLFIYPEQRVATVNQLVLPAGRPVHFMITSASVLNAFFIPQLGSMIYGMNGMTSELNLIANEPGTYRGMSAHYSGQGFSDMHFEVRAVPAGEFAGWVNSTRDTGDTLDGARYTALARQTIGDPPSAFGRVDADLYKRIVSGDLPPGPGPELGPGGAEPAPAKTASPNAMER